MRPETAYYLAKAHEDIRDANIAAGAGLTKVAARLAYYAMFHSAEAVIFERTVKVAKTHSGVRTEFARLSLQEPEIDPVLRGFLTKSYKYKELADYTIGEPIVIPIDEVEIVINRASRFLYVIESLLAR